MTNDSVWRNWTQLIFFYRLSFRVVYNINTKYWVAPVKRKNYNRRRTVRSLNFIIIPGALVRLEERLLSCLFCSITSRGASSIRAAGEKWNWRPEKRFLLEDMLRSLKEYVWIILNSNSSDGLKALRKEGRLCPAQTLRAGSAQRLGRMVGRLPPRSRRPGHRHCSPDRV
jgi:hypothetical protein